MQSDLSNCSLGKDSTPFVIGLYCQCSDCQL